MAKLEFEQLLDAGCHFGHLKRKWNPKMAPYIFKEHNGIHVIDLQKTIVKADEAANALKQIAKSGKKILFVATKKQAKEVVAEVGRPKKDVVLYKPAAEIDEAVRAYATPKMREAIQTQDKLERLETLGKPVLITESVWGTPDAESRKPYLESELYTYKKFGIGFSCHTLCTSKCADCFPPAEAIVPMKGGLYMAFLDKNYEIRPHHEIFNEL